MGLDFSDYSFSKHRSGSEIVNYQPARVPTTAEASNDTLYYGFLSESSAWVIMRRTISTGTMKYVDGSSGFDAAWTAKTTQTYVDYSGLFP